MLFLPFLSSAGLKLSGEYIAFFIQGRQFSFRLLSRKNTQISRTLGRRICLILERFGFQKLQKGGCTLDAVMKTLISTTGIRSLWMIMLIFDQSILDLDHWCNIRISDLVTWYIFVSSQRTWRELINMLNTMASAGIITVSGKNGAGEVNNISTLGSLQDASGEPLFRERLKHHRTVWR